MGSKKWSRGMILSLTLVILGSGLAFAVGGKYGIEAEDEASVSNAGALVVDGTVPWTSPYVEGIHATNTTGNVANSGSIDAFASDESASAYGIGASITGGDIINSGTIEAETEADSSASAYGIMAQGTLGSILNSGSILAEAEAHNTYAAGIDAQDTGGDIINSGEIRAYARSMVSGAYGLNISGAEGDIINSGSILAEAESDASTAAWGINIYELDGQLLNSGSVAATATSGGFARAFAIFTSDTGAILNEDDLTATATGVGADSGADAFGIEADLTYGDIDTSGDITTAATATGTGSADAEGIDADDTDGVVSNSGTIAAVATAANGLAEATGIDTDVSQGVDNSGTIIASARSSGGNAKAWGMDAEETDGDITNSETINVSAFAGTSSGRRADVWGLYAYQTVGNIANEGRITTSTTGYYALSWGIFAQYTTGSITNGGAIEATAFGEDNGQAFGIYSYHTSGDIINSGVITAQSTVGDAYTVEGITSDTTGGSIINSGTVNAIGTTYDDSEVTGILTSRTDGDIVNSGDISAVATSEIGYSRAVGVYIYDLGGVMENTGTIEAFASGPDSRAYGIAASSGGAILNSGSIYVTADEGAGFYLSSGTWDISNPGFVFTSGNTRTLDARGGVVANLQDDFRIIFDGDPESMDYLAPLLASYGGTLNLNDATLLAQAGNDIVWNTPYPVIENDASTVNGEFGGLQSVNPNIAVSWEDAGSTGEDAAVVFDYAPKASAAAQGLRMANLGVMQAGNLIQQRTFSELLARYVRQQETMLADSGQTASDSGFLVARAADGSGSVAFIRPYLHTVNRPSDGDMGYDGSLLGIVAGYEWLASRELTMGLHAGLGVGSIDFKGTGYDANDEEQQVYSLGLHGAYNPGAWHFDGSATLYAANHEYEGLTGGGLTIEEEDDYTSYGAEAEAIGGYVFSSGCWAAMPYAGLGYSWINAPSHTSDADNSNWDTDYDSVDEHIARSILGGQISGNWASGETKIIPTLGLRWEYALTDNEISVSQSLPGTGSVEVDDEVDQSSFIADASVVFVKGAASMELGATSLYNDDYTSYGGWLTLKWEF